MFAQVNCALAALTWLNRTKRKTDRARFLIEHGDIGQESLMRLLRQHGLQNDFVIIPKRTEGAQQEVAPSHAADFVAYEYRREHTQV